MHCVEGKVCLLRLASDSENRLHPLGIVFSNEGQPIFEGDARFKLMPLLWLVPAINLRVLLQCCLGQFA